MAVGVENWPKIYPIAGVKLGVAAAGVKYANRNDVVLVEIAEGSQVAGVFTQNAFCAAPVTLAKESLAIENMSKRSVRYFLVNSGNANACTGQAGIAAAKQTMQTVADCTGVIPQAVLPFSTGVIGELLPADKIGAAIPEAINSLCEQNWLEAAKTIMTTDTRPKGASIRVEVDGQVFHVTGIAKGSGMIRPNMATMLGYVATDLKISREVLQNLSAYAANKSFNRITIDGDTSTNDACMLVATGLSSAPALTDSDGAYFEKVRDAIVQVYQSLSQQIVRDGEGATKFVTVNVGGGVNNDECLQVAYSVAHSPLVKTALFASDPNWGRIVAAIGYAGIPDLDDTKVKVSLDDVAIVTDGGRASTYTEEAGQEVFNKEAFSINIHLGRGAAQETIWTSDLSHQYVTINAEYRT